MAYFTKGFYSKSLQGSNTIPINPLDQLKRRGSVNTSGFFKKKSAFLIMYILKAVDILINIIVVFYIHKK